MRGEFAAKQALFAARGGARTPLRAIETRGLLRAIFFFSFWSFRERKGRQEEEEEEAKDKNFGTREEKNQFFFKKRELERTRDSAKNVAHFSSARFCLNEKQTEKENAATKMMARAMSAGRFDFRGRIIDFFFEECDLFFILPFLERREREKEKERSRLEKTKKIIEEKWVSFFARRQRRLFSTKMWRKRIFFLSFLPRTKIKMRIVGFSSAK